MAKNLPADPELLQLVGAVVAWWGRIEGRLVHDLISLRQHPDHADYAAEHGFPASTPALLDQWEHLQTAANLADGNRHRMFVDLAEELRALSGERRMIVGFFWPYGSQDPSRIALQSIMPVAGNPAEFSFSGLEISTDMLRGFADRLEDCFQKVMAQSVNLLVNRGDAGAASVSEVREGEMMPGISGNRSAAL